MRTRSVSSSPRAHSILLTCRCTSSVREARKPLRDNNHGQTASHLCQEFWILMAMVGGSSVIAALAMMKRAAGWQLSAILAGVIMLLWIVAEIASIRGLHFLQVVYFVTGAAVIWLTPKAESVPR